MVKVYEITNGIFHSMNLSDWISSSSQSQPQEQTVEPYVVLRSGERVPWSRLQEQEKVDEEK